TRTIIRLVSSIPNALNFCAAYRAWTAKFPMNRHLRPKGRDILRKIRAYLLAQKTYPVRHCFLSGAMKTLNFLLRQFLRQGHRREPRPMQDLIRIRIANPAEKMRIGERAFQRVIAPSKCSGKYFE